MPKVKFTKDYEVRSADRESYEAGQEINLSEESANHFVSRGVAEIVSAKKSTTKKSEEK